MTSNDDLQAIVDGWSPNMVQPEPRLGEEESKVLRRLKQQDIVLYGFGESDALARCLQTAMALSQRTPPLASLVDCAYKITREGYVALVPERNILTGLLGTFRWMHRLDSTVDITAAAARLKLPAHLAESYIDRLIANGLITLEPKTSSTGCAYEAARLTSLGKEIIAYLIKQA
jgi:predicted transcriptional regulator